jgi:effector-binding domain-containing protein
MIDAPKIVQSAPLLRAFIHLTVPNAEIRNVMGPGLKEVRDAIAAQGITPAGSWFTHHLKQPGAQFDFKICIPIVRPMKPAGRVNSDTMPARRVAKTMYYGKYEGLPAAWGELMKWMNENGHKPAQDLWEVYAAGPESGPDPSTWRTELNRPLM